MEGGDDIGIRGLSEASGQARSTLERWSKTELWVDQRRQFQGTLKAVTQQKSIEKASEKLSDELADVAIANYKAHKLARDYALAIFQIKARHIKKVQSLPDDEQMKELKNHSASEMNYWSLILARSTQEIANSTGLAYYININTSAKKLEQEGYVVLDPREDVEEEGERTQC